MQAKDLILTFGVGVVVAVAITLGGCARQQMGTEQPTGMGQEGEQLSTEAFEPVTSIQELTPDYSVSYYLQQFETLGYEIRDVERRGQQLVYDLRRDGEMKRVMLTQPEGQRMISEVRIQSARRVDEQTETRAAEVISELRKMPVGKQPADYVPMASKLGRVTDYERDAEDAEISLDVGGEQFEMEMMLDPGTDTVTDIQVSEEIWGL